MFWRGESLTHRLILTIGLFLIGSLHTMIFTIFQIPENFLLGRDSEVLAVICKIILYSCAIGISFFHQTICLKFGLRKALYFGLLCNFLAVATLLLNQNFGLIPLILLDMMLFGLALTSVINALVTYIVIEYPKKVGLAIVALFAFFNLGALCAPLLLDIFPANDLVYYFLLTLLIFSIWFVHFTFFDPPVSREIHLKKGSRIWRELHYRLAFFIIAIVAYALTETTFSLWGYLKVEHHFGTVIANETTPFFWLFMIIGQLFLLIPLYFLPAKRIFYVLMLMVIASTLMFPIQKNIGGFILWFAIAGFGCSAAFPILPSQMEKEILTFAAGEEILPCVEKSLSLLIASYFLGIGIIDLWVQLAGKTSIFAVITHFHFATCFIAITALLFMFLSITFRKV